MYMNEIRRALCDLFYVGDVTKSQKCFASLVNERPETDFNFNTQKVLFENAKSLTLPSL